MKLIKLSLATLILSTLVACGSGGGGGDSASPNTSNTSNTAQPAPPSTPQAGTVKGHRHKRENLITRENIEATQDKNILVVDGQAVILVPANFSAKKFFSSSSAEQTIGVDNSLSYLKHGFYSKKSAKKEYFFVQGNETLVKNMPTTGEFTYKGSSITQRQGNKDITDGEVSFLVNFQTRTLSGTATGGQLTAPVELRANITDNTFHGTHDGTITEGHFYGPKAEEMGGTFFKDKSFIGTFGAKKQ